MDGAIGEDPSVALSPPCMHALGSTPEHTCAHTYMTYTLREGMKKAHKEPAIGPRVNFGGLQMLRGELVRTKVILTEYQTLRQPGRKGKEDSILETKEEIWLDPESVSSKGQARVVLCPALGLVSSAACSLLQVSG